MSYSGLLRRELLCLATLLPLGCDKPHLAHSNLHLDDGYTDTNGTKYPGIYGLVVNPTFSQLGSATMTPSCTATAISSTVLVTAAHCLKKTSQPLIYYFVDYNLKPLYNTAGGYLIGEAQAHPLSQYSSGVSWRQPYDLAFIRVQTPSFTSTYRFSDREASPGDSAKLIGYGTDRRRQTIGRQYGFNKVVSILKPGSIDPLGHPVREIYNSLILVSFDRSLNNNPNQPANTGTVPGDSGGPLLVDGKVAGILYGGAYWNQQRDEENEEDRGRFDDSIYVNLRTSFHQDFAETLRKNGWDIPQ